MDHPVQSPSIYRFGVFEADLGIRELRKHGIRVRLQEQPFRVLIELLRRPGVVVTREELRERLWAPDTFVDFEEGVNTAVKRLRSCLGDSSENPVYVETVARYGYRFIAPVIPLNANGRAAPVTETGPEVVLVKTVSKSPQAKSRSLWNLHLLGPCLLLALVALTAISIYGKWKRRTEIAPSTIQSVAVMPLENLSAEASQEYFADGITDEITTGLAKLAGPKVISRTSVMQYKGTHKTIPEIARDLNVEAIVEGSVESAGSRVRVRVQLIQASTDRHLWAEEYDRQMNDVLQLESDVAQDIAMHVQTQLTPQQQRVLTVSRSINPQAFQDYLLGRHYWALRTRESLAKAIEYFNRAILEDPNDARSYAGLAHCYIVMPMLTGMPQTEALAKAKDAASKAISLDGSLAEAHLAIAEALFFHDWDFAGAEEEFRRTLELNRNYSTGHQWYGEFLTTMGRHQEAIREQKLALALDPLSAVIHHQAGNTLRDAGHYDEAIQQYREALNIHSNFYATHQAVSWLFRRQGKFIEAIQSLRMTIPGFVNDDHINPAIASAINALQLAYAKGGRVGFFRQCVKVHSFYLRPHSYLARDYGELGDRDKAIAELSYAYRDHEMEALSAFTAPELNSVRSDPRFQRLIRTMGFPH